MNNFSTTARPFNFDKLARPVDVIYTQQQTIPKTTPCLLCFWNQKKGNSMDTKEYRPIYEQARRNSGRRGIGFNITYDEFKQIVSRSNGACEVTGLKFNFDSTGKGKKRPFAPSLDRINSALDYCSNNCRLVCVAANPAMNEWGDSVLNEISQSMNDLRVETFAEVVSNNLAAQFSEKIDKLLNQFTEIHNDILLMQTQNTTVIKPAADDDVLLEQKDIAKK